jgi:hypothetical protein
MEELLFDYSLDSYKPPALNAPFLAREAIELIGKIQDGVINDANLDFVLAELEWAIQGDPIAKSLLESPIGSYVHKHPDTPITDKKIGLEVLFCILEPHRYYSKCGQMLYEAIVHKSKKGVEHCARMLCTTLINIGLSKQRIAERLFEFFYSNVEISSNEQVLEFLDKIFPFGHEFQVFIYVGSDIALLESEAKAFGLEVLERLPNEVEEAISEQGLVFNAPIGCALVRVNKITARDCYTALEIARRRLNRLSDIFMIFSHKNKIEFEQRALIGQCCESGFRIVFRPRSSMEKGFDLRPGQAAKKLKLFLSGFRLSEENGSQERFDSVVDLHGLALKTDVPESQLLNVWIAIETLVPSKADKNKLSLIVNGVMPILLNKYIRRFVERLAGDLLRWNKWKTRRIAAKVDSGKKLDFHQRLIRLLVCDENSGLREELYAAVGDFHLLRNRIFHLSDQLKTGEKAVELIELHKLKVEWQIRRMYRTRNLIVHSGASAGYLEVLIENGHDYLDQVLEELISLSCGVMSVHTIEQAFEVSRLRNLKLMADLKSIDSFNSDNADVLLGY